MNKSPQQQANEIKTNLIKKIAAQRSFLEVEATKHIKDSFFDFGKAPIDSGESQDKSLAKLLLGSFGLIIKMAIQTDYAIYFIRPVKESNPNFKYGERNPMAKAEQKIVNTILKNL